MGDLAWTLKLEVKCLMGGMIDVVKGNEMGKSIS
jgi:hypothetical protein